MGIFDSFREYKEASGDSLYLRFDHKSPLLIDQWNNCRCVIGNSTKEVMRDIELTLQGYGVEFTPNRDVVEFASGVEDRFSLEPEEEVSISSQIRPATQNKLRITVECTFRRGREKYKIHRTGESVSEKAGRKEVEQQWTTLIREGTAPGGPTRKLGQKEEQNEQREEEVQGWEEPPQTFGELVDKGFKPLSTTLYGIPTTVYWHPEKKFELQVTHSGENYLLKGMKKYYIKGVSKEGRETWDRNLGKLMDRVKNSFPEYHLYAAGISEPPDLVEKEEKLDSDRERVEELEKKVDCMQQIENIKGFDEHVDLYLSELPREMQGYVMEVIQDGDHPKIAARKATQEKKKLREKIREVEKEIGENQEFISQFARKGVANSFIIACSTSLLSAKKANFDSVFDEVIEEIESKHLHGGFIQSVKKGLKVNIEEVDLPWVAHQAEFVGLFPPDQVSGQPELTDGIRKFFWATALEDIKVGGKVKEKGKKTPARVMKAFLDRVETTSTEKTATGDVPTEGGWIGNLIQGEEVTDTPFLFDLDKLNHGYLSGTTGSGKTYTARALVENAILKGVDVVVLDTTRQWCGLAKPASGIKKRLKKLGVDRDLPTGFPANIYTPNSSAGEKLPENLSQLADGISVVTLKGLYDEERCEIARDILSDIYMSTDRETEQLKTLLVIEEAHTFLPGNVDPSAKEVAKECEKRIERISREARKYGLNLLVVSQSLSDFKRSSKTVREMMNSKFFMRATDRSEINYVEDYVSKEAAGWVRNLDVGEVLVNSPGVGPAKVFIRPPFSEVGELSDSEIEEAVGAQEEKFEGVDKGDFLAKVSAVKEGEVKAKPETSNLSEEEEKLIQVAKKHLEEEDEPIHLTKAAEKAEIYSMGRLSELVEDLEERGVIETKKLKKRGNPRGIIPKT